MSFWHKLLGIESKAMKYHNDIIENTHGEFTVSYAIRDFCRKHGRLPKHSDKLKDRSLKAWVAKVKPFRFREHYSVGSRFFVVSGTFEKGSSLELVEMVEGDNGYKEIARGSVKL